LRGRAQHSALGRVLRRLTPVSLLSGVGRNLAESRRVFGSHPGSELGASERSGVPYHTVRRPVGHDMTDQEAIGDADMLLLFGDCQRPS